MRLHSKEKFIVIEFRLPTHVVLLAAAVTLAACAAGSGGWSKANVTAEAMATDMDECDFIGQAAALSAANRTKNTYVGVSSTGQLTTTQLPGADALSFMEQGNAFAKCMRARGYKRKAAP